MIYLKLFLAFFQIGLFSFGGGYAALPLIQEQVVNINKWITLSDFTDLITISQMTPGPIAINAATFVGNQVAGIFGGVVATFGCIFPSCIIATILAFIYNKYRNLELLQSVLSLLRPAIVGMIAVAGVSIFIPTIFDGEILNFVLKIKPCMYFIIAIILLRKFKVDPVIVMILCGLLEVITNFIGI